MRGLSVCPTPQAIAPYKNRNPGSIDEEEYLENLFNSLCACLMSEQTRNLFLKAEGKYVAVLPKATWLHTAFAVL